MVARRREELLALVAADPARKLYGINVHAGDGSDRLMTEAEQRDYARGLHSATSFGEPLPRRVVRGIVLARLANFIEGHAGVTPELVRLVAERLDGRDLPPVPRLGNGGSGEILALGWLFADVPAKLELGVKETMSLINGAPCAPALLADAHSLRRADAGDRGAGVLPGGGGVRRRRPPSTTSAWRRCGATRPRPRPCRRSAPGSRAPRRRPGRAPTRSRRSASASCPGCWATPTAWWPRRVTRLRSPCPRSATTRSSCSATGTRTSATSSPTAGFTTAPRRRASTA